jgi:hypothetical protein
MVLLALLHHAPLVKPSMYTLINTLMLAAVVVIIALIMFGEEYGTDPELLTELHHRCMSYADARTPKWAPRERYYANFSACKVANGNLP